MVVINREPGSFWRIEHPKYESDYDFTYINGSAYHPLGLPGVKCDICGQTWGGSRILDIPCPQRLINRKEINNSWPIPAKEHRILRQEVSKALGEEGYLVDVLKPSDRFQPAYIEIPTIPEYDFLWGSIGSVIISERVKDVFEANEYRNIRFCPVKFKLIGKNKVKLPAPIPSTGEPEDIYNEVDLLSDFRGISNYFEMVILAESRTPPGAQTISTCEGCGREEYDQSKRLLIMNQDMWKGDDIFFLSTTLWIVITEPVKQSLVNMGATNINFKKL